MPRLLLPFSLQGSFLRLARPIGIEIEIELELDKDPVTRCWKHPHLFYAIVIATAIGWAKSDTFQEQKQDYLRKHPTSSPATTAWAKFYQHRNKSHLRDHPTSSPTTGWVRIIPSGSGIKIASGSILPVRHGCHDGCCTNVPSAAAHVRRAPLRTKSTAY